MRKEFILTFIYLIASFTSYCAVYRVNNMPGINADYNTFVAAQTAAAIGDTLHIEGSFISYGAITLSKRLVLIGAGFMLEQNDTTQALPYASRFSSLTVSSSASNSFISGFHIENNQTSALVNIQANQVIFTRNYVLNTNCTSSTARGLQTSSNLNGIIIMQNFIHCNCTSTTYSQPALFIESGNSGIVVSNNILLRGNSAVNTTTLGSSIQMSSTNSSAIVTNNVLSGSITLFNSILQNNIHVNGSFTNNNDFPNSIANNISHNTFFGNTNGNLQNITMSNVFSFSGPLGFDKYWTLKPGSPGIAAGIGGSDCGAYGGNLAYKKSGIPAIPSIYSANVPMTANSTTGLQINIESKSNN